MVNYKNLIEIIDKYDKAEIIHIKNNLYELLKERNLKQSFLVKLLNISSHMAKNYINASNPYGKIPLKYLLEICNVLNVEIDMLLIENNRSLGASKCGIIKWNEDKQIEFLYDVENMTIKNVAEKYDISESSISQRCRLIKSNKQY